MYTGYLLTQFCLYIIQTTRSGIYNLESITTTLPGRHHVEGIGSMTQSYDSNKNI